MQLIDLLETFYSGLAETFASPELAFLPNWMAMPGDNWPFFDEATHLSSISDSTDWKKAVKAMQDTPGSTIETRRQEYEQLFIGSTHPPIWLYEAHYVDGRLLGPSSFNVSKLYAQNGLEVEGSELPDHASMELAFLAFLVHQESLSAGTAQAQTWMVTRKAFIKEHAGVWLPLVGKALIESGYPAWTAIGYLLIASLTDENKGSKHKAFPTQLPKNIVPRIERVNHGNPGSVRECILCGFCVQICPTHALAIHEDKQTTSLWLSVPNCIHCQKCMHVCPEHVIEMVPENSEVENRFVFAGKQQTSQKYLLYESPRVACPKCGESTVSRAELEYVIRCIGHPNWLDYCANCRNSS